MSKTDARLATLPGQRNYYVKFLNNTRWLDDEQLLLRHRWYDTLAQPNKDALLFRMEMLLAGIWCAGNTENFPAACLVDKETDMRPYLGLVQKALTELIDLVVELVVDGAQTVTSTLDFFSNGDQVDDDMRVAHLEQEALSSDPAGELSALLSSLQNTSELIGGLLVGAERISHRQYVAVSVDLSKAIMAARTFNTIARFEFREQYDQVIHQQVLLTLSSMEHDATRRITSITVIALFRLLHILDLLDEPVVNQHPGVLFALLCLVSSDGQGYARFWTNETAQWVSDDFGRAFLALTPDELEACYDDLDLQFAELKSLRELLESTGNQLALELKKAFYLQLPDFGQERQVTVLQEQVQVMVRSLRSFLQNAVVLIIREFNVNIDGDDLFADFTSDVTRSDRLRRDVWMFRQILKAFVVKTRDAERVGDRWVGINTFKFVKTFVDYFRSVGYQLLRYSDYERFDKFMALIDRLREGDVLEVQRLSHVVEECEAFYEFLDTMFQAISLRKELIDVPFDTRDAAKTLKLFIQ